MKRLLASVLAATSLAAQTAQVWGDRTKSVSAPDMTRTLTALRSRLPVIAEKARLQRVEVFSFADDAFGADPHTSIQLPRLTVPECDPLGEAASVLRKVRLRHDKDCTDAREKARVPWRANLAETIKQRFPVKLEPASRKQCTSVYELLDRLSSAKSDLTVILTDGIDDCHRGKLEPLPQPRARVVMVVVEPAGGPRYYDHVKATRKRWEKAAPWLEILTKAQLDEI